MQFQDGLYPRGILSQIGNILLHPFQSKDFVKIERIFEKTCNRGFRACITFQI